MFVFVISLFVIMGSRQFVCWNLLLTRILSCFWPLDFCLQVALNYEDNGANLSSETRAAVEAEVRRLTSAAYQRATDVLKKHEKELHALAAVGVMDQALADSRLLMCCGNSCVPLMCCGKHTRFDCPTRLLRARGGGCHETGTRPLTAVQLGSVLSVVQIIVHMRYLSSTD